MTRKHYEAIAYTLRNVRPWSEEPIALAAWNEIVEALAKTLEVDGGFDLNGNRRFKRDRFLAACNA